jgi:AcrR family transcriptional regulator
VTRPGSLVTAAGWIYPAVVTSTSAGRRGPRTADAADTRAAILREARRAFAEGGYAGTSLRQVAQRAGVDASLLSYYFGSKENLFTAAMELPASPREVVVRALEEPRDRLGEALVRGMLAAWADEESRLAARGVLQSLSTRTDFGETLIDYAGEHVVGPLAAALGTPDAAYRATLALTQLTGLAIARHVVEAGPIAGALDDQLVATVGPVVQHYLTGDLATPPAH